MVELGVILKGLTMAAAFIGAPYYFGTQHGVEPLPCAQEPIRVVRWTGPDAPSYQFEVAGCEFSANADKYTVVEVKR